MIHHFSISAKNPERVASVLAEIWQGKAYPFPPHPGSHMVVPGDEYGSLIEIYPLGTELTPSSGNEPIFSRNPSTSSLTATHAAISVPTEAETIAQIGDRQGWRVQVCDRGPFRVVEFWVENRLLLELLPPAMASEYLEFVKPENIEAYFERASVAVG
ncbi:MAG TPA: hypothetical protein IGS17_20525 [Oscillatoriales cyanobacterium M59_W2019_021]|nr:hypothetical protein [Oscillatoriales cyanobacterium M4454_W2019_049]HIK53280.1 hypothetical protein [Oscillatoriales cyanobacterium M59_W2019_021]